jgi:hypothetical protein
MVVFPASWFVFAASVAMAEAQRAVPVSDPTPRPVAEIRIARQRVFQIDNGPAAPFARIGDLLHIDTREHVIRDLLLFRSGDPITPALAQEAERVLRQSGLFVTARIALTARNDSAFVRVTTRDVWSTQIVARYKSAGGADEISLGAIENNFLGLGDAVSSIYRWSDEEDVFTFALSKRRVLSPYAQANVSYGESGESVSRAVSFGQPNYSELATWSGAIGASTFDGNVTLYRDGEKSGRYRTHWDVVTAHYSAHRGEDIRWRMAGGLTLDDRRSMPIEGDSFGLASGESFRNDRRRQVSASVGVHNRRYIIVTDLDRAGDPEDFSLGSLGCVVLGVELEALGSSYDRPYISLFGRHSRRVGSHGAIVAHAGASSFYRNSAASARELVAVVKGYHQAWRGHTQVFRALFHGGLDLHPEEFLYLGASEGLRGFPYRAFRGTRVAVASAEHRIEPGLPLLGAHLGVVFFADAGYAWQHDQPMSLRDVRSDVGAGLRMRFGSLVPVPVRLDVGRGLGAGGEVQISFGLGQLFRLVQRVDYPVPAPFRFGSSLE